MLQNLENLIFTNLMFQCLKYKKSVYKLYFLCGDLFYFGVNLLPNQAILSSESSLRKLGKRAFSCLFFPPSLSPSSKYLEQINTITSNKTDMPLLENRGIPSLEIGKNIAAM